MTDDTEKIAEIRAALTQLIARGQDWTIYQRADGKVGFLVAQSAGTVATIHSKYDAYFIAHAPEYVAFLLYKLEGKP